MECDNAMTVIAGAMLSSAHVIAPSVKNDVLDSILFSQLYADGKGVKFDEPEKWFSEHDTAMRNLKWSLLYQYSEDHWPKSGGRVDVAELVETQWLSRLPEGTADGVRKMLVSIAATPVNDAPRALFREHVLKAPTDEMNAVDLPPTVSTLVLQLGFLAPDGILHSLYVSYKTTAVVGDDLFPNNDGDHQIAGKVETRFLQRHWDAAGYTKVRGSVDEFLTGKRSGLILPVSCESSVPSGRIPHD